MGLEVVVKNIENKKLLNAIGARLPRKFYQLPFNDYTERGSRSREEKYADRHYDKGHNDHLDKHSDTSRHNDYISYRFGHNHVDEISEGRSKHTDQGHNDLMRGHKDYWY